MKRTLAPTTAQANTLFFVTVLLTLLGSSVFASRLGMGTNLWINEFVYILLPPLLLAKLQGWPLEGVYKLRGTSVKNCLLSILAGVSLWLTASYVTQITRLFLDKAFGVLILDEAVQSLESTPYQIYLFLMGTVILAPICEEIFFRGFVQAAYERHSPRYGYIITGILFGSYHALNGISDVVPATILGVAMGYLAHRTGSLAPAMLFHAAANMTSMFSGFLGIFHSNQMAGWMHLAAPAALVLTVFLLRRVQGEPATDESEPQSREALGGILFLVLAVLLFAVVGVLEILLRLGRLTSW